MNLANDKHLLFTYLNTPVYIHYTWLIFLMFMFLGGLTSVAIFISVFAIVVLHEFGHILVGKMCKMAIYDIVLYPIGGAARMEIPKDPFQEIFVALAGPMVNVILILPLYLLSSFNQNNFFEILFSINLVILIFNLLPSFPMDGGRVFRAFLSFFLNRVTATLIAVRVAQVIFSLMAIYGLCYGQIMLIFIAIFMVFQAEVEKESVKNEFDFSQSTSGLTFKDQRDLDSIMNRIRRF